MRYPHICGTVDAVQRQPTLIPLSTGIGCPDFLRSFEDMPPLPTTTNLEYPYAHSDIAVGLLYNENHSLGEWFKRGLCR